MKRTKLKDRLLPDYSRGEEVTNMVTHIAGGALAVAAATLCIVFSALHGNSYSVVSAAIYGFTLITLYTVSSIYHGIPVGMGKKVMQVIDHCTIYFLIAGTYTVIAISALRPVYPTLGWGILIFEWSMVGIAASLTAIDLKKYAVFSMICYVGMGWAIVPFLRQVYTVLTGPGFFLLLFGGIAYTIGAVLYGLGRRRKWMHSIFHIFVVLGSILQFFAVLLYAI